MKALSRNLLAGALLAALPMGGALACTTSAWTNGATTTAEAGSPAQGVARYSGECGLSAGAGEFVVSEHPTNETTFRARFYVFTSAAGNTTVFDALDAGSSSVISVQYLPGSDAFSFTIPGSTVANVTGIEENKWYGVEVFRQVGAPAQVAVRGGGPAGGSADPATPKVDASVTGTGNATGNGVDTARLGSISGGAVVVDEFESTRSTTTPIGFLTRGDANGDASCDAADISITGAEVFDVLFGSATVDYASAQPDCTENGVVDADDMTCQARIAFHDLFNGLTCGS